MKCCQKCSNYDECKELKVCCELCEYFENGKCALDDDERRYVEYD